jgi:hypothetical protein
LFTQEINVKEETFGISSPSTSEEDHEARQESRHAMNMTPNDPRTEASTCKSSGTQPENGEAWIARIQALTVKEMTSKAHMQVHTNKGSREKQPGTKLGRTGPKYTAQLGEAGTYNSLKVRLFSLSLTGTAFAWFSSLAPNF